LIPTVADDGSQENPLELFLPVEGSVAYHGTSSVFADRIESVGLGSDNGVWTPEDCRAVCGVFEKLQWFGLSNGGYVVLGPWGPDRDVETTGHRHIYLAETYSLAASYARAPGGETSEALLKSLDDLVRFQADERIRREHITQLRRKLGSSGGSAASEIILAATGLAENSQWLAVNNEAFQSLRERLRQLTLNHKRVVYAVLLDKATLRGGTFSTSMGIEVTKPIPARQIIAKAFPVAPRKSGREIGPDTPPGRFDALMELWATWSSRVDEANA
jgi:hypothetical protein